MAISRSSVGQQIMKPGKKKRVRKKKNANAKPKNKNNRVVAKTPFWHEDWGNQFSPIESQRPSSKNFWKV